jgi:acetate kinase
MGFTPMEGLVMGTRSGDIDPGFLLYLLRLGKTPAFLDDLLNHRSGLAGISGRSGDMRELERLAQEGDERATLAIEMFAYRVSKYVASYAAVLGGIDALTFTAGIGENSARVRALVCSRLAFLGVSVDDSANRVLADTDRRISDGPVDVWVIRANEELQMARMALEIVRPGTQS